MDFADGPEQIRRPILSIKAVTCRLDNRNSPERDVTKPMSLGPNPYRASSGISALTCLSQQLHGKYECYIA
jgi:hypothetical protein